MATMGTIDVPLATIGAIDVPLATIGAINVGPEERLLNCGG